MTDLADDEAAVKEWMESLGFSFTEYGDGNNLYNHNAKGLFLLPREARFWYQQYRVMLQRLLNILKTQATPIGDVDVKKIEAAIRQEMGR